MLLSIRRGSSCTVFWKDARHTKRIADEKKLVANRVDADTGRRSIVCLRGFANAYSTVVSTVELFETFRHQAEVAGLLGRN